MKNRMKSAERRAAIVESAIQLFAEKGFRGTTTRELAGQVGVTEPVLYQHFHTKQDLYSAIIETKASAATDDAGDFFALAGGDNDRAFFTALGELVLGRFERDPLLLRLLLFSALERHELSALFFDRVMADFFRLVAGYIRRRIRAGAFRPVNPEVAARSLIGMVHYHGLMGLLHPERRGRISRKKVVGDMVAIFLDGVSAPAGLRSAK